MDQEQVIEQSSTNDNALIAAIIVGGLLILTLLVIIFLQNRKIKYLEKPKFGFLGKPLSFFALMLMVGAFAGGIYVSQSDSQQPAQNINANTEIELKINATVLNRTNNTYSISIEPIINRLSWGGDETNEFDVVWTVQNKSVRTFFETGLTLTSRGGITVDLEDGENQITATVSIQNRIEETTITINVN